MDRVVITRPFVEGVNYDSPEYLVRPRQATAMTNAIAPRDVIMQRKGWSYDGSSAVTATILRGFWRTPYVLADVTRSVVSDASNNIYIHNGSSSGTLIGQADAAVLPRAVYRDETI